jgi:probable rRNA maturation factor
MLKIFWEVTEASITKKEIDKELISTEKELLRSPFFVSRKNKTISVIFCDNGRIRQLNRDFRAKDAETDVLSFAESDCEDNSRFLAERNFLGEIFINYDWIKKGKDHGLIGIREIFVHGALHLIGFDHEKDNGEMKQAEKTFYS